MGLAGAHTREAVPAEACTLVLPLYEAMGRWRDALALPHVTPSAAAFSRALEAECEQEAWLRAAESTRSTRWAGRRDAAVTRWREEVLGVAGTAGANDGGAGSDFALSRLREALRSVLQLVSDAYDSIAPRPEFGSSALACR